jgi:predicted nucleotidyltransferase
MPEILNKFIKEVKNAYGHNLKSIVLFGSKASGEDTEKHSDHNLLFIVEKIDFKDLKSLNKIIKPWIKKGNPPPLIFTADKLKSSTDVFPVEFYDMKDHHKVLFGEDPLKDLKIEDKNLRHECEFELKGKLLKLQQGYVSSRNKADARNLLINSVSTFLLLFRHTIRLFGGTPPLKRLDALKILAEKTGLNPSVFVTIFNMKQGDREALKKDPEPLMEEYLKEIEKIVDAVDKLQ